MKKRFIIFVSLLFAFMLSSMVYANNKTVTCTQTVNGNEVHIQGQISGAVTNNQVTLVVSEDINNVTESNIVYIDQTTSAADGTFEFSFTLPGNSDIDSYGYIIGTDAGTATYNGTLTKEEQPGEEIIPNQTITCTEEVKGNNVYIQGQILNATTNNQVTLIVSKDVNNITESNIVYIDQTTSSTDGTFGFTFTLPETTDIRNYGYIIGTDAGASTYKGTLTKEEQPGEEIIPNQTITCTEEVNGNNVYIQGQILNATTNNQVTLVVSEDINNVTESNIVYIDQTTSALDGTFEFSFTLPENSNVDSYGYIIGTDANALTYTGTVSSGPQTEMVKNQFVNADITVSISNYVPTISGTITCYDGKTVTANIINTTDGITVANDVFNAGEHSLSYQLPSLIAPKKYSMIITCNDGDEELTALSVTIDSSVILVSISGEATVADGVTLNVGVQSNNSSLIDKSTTITSNKNVSVTIPNIISNTSYHLTATGYRTETVIVPEEDETGYKYVLSGNSGENVNVIATGVQITSFDKVYTVKYDKDQITATSLYGTYYEDSLQTGTKGNVEIVSFEPGKIEFKIINEQVVDGKSWSGILNIFKFKFNHNYSGNTNVSIY